MSSERTLNFNWSGLTQNTTILLTFDNLVKTLTLKQNYVAWKVIQVRAPSGNAAVIFPGGGGFGQSLLANGKIVVESDFIEVPLGFGTHLITENSGNNVFTAPVHDPQLEQLISARNKTGLRQSMSVGTITDGHFSPAFFWDGVGDELTIEVDFQCTLRIHVGKEYKEGEWITADLASGVLWKHDLVSLDAVTSLELVQGQGGFEIRS